MTPNRPIKISSFDSIPDSVDKPLRDLLEQIIHHIDLREGRIAPGTNTRFVSIQDLVDAGVVPDGTIE